MTLEYDLFWSFRSPYSYLVTSRLVAMERDYDVKCNVRVLGETSFDWRGQRLTVGVFPYRLYLLQRILDAADALDAGARARLDALFARTGLTPLLACRPVRRVERDNNLEVWGDAQ